MLQPGEGMKGGVVSLGVGEWLLMRWAIKYKLGVQNDVISKKGYQNYKKGHYYFCGIRSIFVAKMDAATAKQGHKCCKIGT